MDLPGTNLLLRAKARVLRTYGLVYVLVLGWYEEDEVGAVDMQNAYELYRAGAVFIDVRSPSEWSRGSVHRAMFANAAKMDHIVPKPASTDLLVTFCEAGDRARRAAKQLRSEGYTNVYYLWPGGYTGWARAGLPIAT